MNSHDKWLQKLHDSIFPITWIQTVPTTKQPCRSMCKKKHVRFWIEYLRLSHVISWPIQPKTHIRKMEVRCQINISYCIHALKFKCVYVHKYTGLMIGIYTKPCRWLVKVCDDEVSKEIIKYNWQPIDI